MEPGAGRCRRFSRDRVPETGADGPGRSRRQPGTMNGSGANITYASRKRRKPVQKT